METVQLPKCFKIKNSMMDNVQKVNNYTEPFSDFEGGE
jgi:hypothetical protein